MTSIEEEARAGPPEYPTAEPYEDISFWESRECLRHIRDFARSRRAAPWAVLSGVLLRVVTATDPGWQLPPIVGGAVSLNLFGVVVGPSGGGKGKAMAVARDAYLIEREIHTGPLGSGEGISHVFAHRTKAVPEKLDQKTGAVVRAAQPSVVDMHRHRALMTASEIRNVGATSMRSGATLVPQMLAAWMGEPLGFTNADPDKTVPLEAHSYRLCVVVQAQPANATTLLGEVDSGLPQRFLWASTTDPGVPEDKPAPVSPKIWPGVRELPHGLVKPEYLSVPDAAVEEIELEEYWKLRDNYVVKPMKSHKLLQQLKVAAALALLEGRTAVTDDDWSLARRVVQHSEDTIKGTYERLEEERWKERARKAAEKAEEDHHTELGRAQLEEEAVERVRGVLRAALTKHARRYHDDPWATKSLLRRALNSRDRKFFDKAVDDIDFEHCERKNGSVSSTCYRIALDPRTERPWTSR
ncbi:hypothetical protein [Prescottella equi]|uniref:hypothetical protein n=1 Tax=Rhodococcus hoagii TaxID=43767 RepID=UPI000A0FCC1C|nr:hypothetical protein [Prescottella equi]ORM00696.1 hypothetical protein A5N69_07070 [Prescottella equi]ORM21563.1 hypothetical protein A5N74_01625 [Prescottella equi]